MGNSLPLGGAKQRAVLGLLLAHADEVISTDRLIDELWGDAPPESAANMLQGYVSHLRKTLEPGRARGEHELLVSRPPGYMLKIRPDQLDAARFERLASEGRSWRQKVMPRRQRCVIGRHLSGGEGRRSQILRTSRLRGARSTASKSCGSWRSRIGSTPSSRWGGTTASSVSSATSLINIRFASGCARK